MAGVLVAMLGRWTLAYPSLAEVRPATMALNEFTESMGEPAVGTDVSDPVVSALGHTH